QCMWRRLPRITAVDITAATTVTVTMTVTGGIADTITTMATAIAIDRYSGFDRGDHRPVKKPAGCKPAGFVHGRRVQELAWRQNT
ncbi:MAG: hypothetical protein Q8S16_14125, partial [Polaromonas sp.]|nr:hypothetical protein [Polaromonas sp.]